MSEQCPSCGAHMAIDQRYCLECGQRRGDPRLPFMDAVVFMDAVKRPAEAPSSPPPPAREPRSRMTANASLIAGVATLVLAIGVGVMIGQSGDNSTPTAAAAPQIIRVGGSGGGEETATASNSGVDSEIGGKGGKAKKGEAPREGDRQQRHL